MSDPIEAAHFPDAFALASASSSAFPPANLYAMAFDCSYEAKMICDQYNTILAVNQAFTDMTGYTQEEVVGKNPRLLASGQMSREFYRDMWASLEDRGSWSGELIERRKDGSTYPKFLTITAVWDEGHVSYYLASFIDITAMKEAHARLERLAHRDTLTGLLNRHSFDFVVTQNIALARRKHERMALLYLDLDGFKKVNDSLGHAVGDELLQIIARRFQEAVRESDAVARLGGDEFAIMLAPQEMARDGVELVADRLLKVASQPVDINGNLLQLSASIGIAFFPDDAGNTAQLMQHADTAMYEAKGTGKNNFHFFSPSLYRRAAERLEVEGYMRRLLAGTPADGFSLAYQPQFSLPDRKLVGLEALLRLVTEDGRHIGPAVFIPVAEDTGLISRIGEWVSRPEWLAAYRQNKRRPPVTQSTPGGEGLRGGHRPTAAGSISGRPPQMRQVLRSASWALLCLSSCSKEPDAFRRRLDWRVLLGRR